MEPDFDAIVIGGGPAGLSAALWLGRYRRRTAVIDAGRQRNLASNAAHGYLTRDGVSPLKLLENAEQEVARYPEVTFVREPVKKVRRAGELFEVTAGEAKMLARRLLLATGVQDACPDVPGFSELYGRSLFHCSCCDGYESRDQDVVAIGWGEHVAGFALDLLDWGARVTLVTNGERFQGDEACRAALGSNEIPIVEDRVTEILRDGDSMTAIRVASGAEIPATRAFFSIAHEPRNDIAVSLGCEIDDLGYVKVGAHGETTVEHVYAAGDVTPGEQLIATAAAEGVVAGIACGMSLRGLTPAPGAPPPGPDPEAELEANS